MVSLVSISSSKIYFNIYNNDLSPEYSCPHEKRSVSQHTTALVDSLPRTQLYLNGSIKEDIMAQIVLMTQQHRAEDRKH